MKDAVEDARFDATQSEAVGEGVRGEDLARSLLRLLGDLRQHLGVSRDGAVLLALFAAIPLEARDHLVEADLVGPSRQLVPSMWSARGIDETGAAQRHQHLVEEWSRDRLPPGDLTALQRAATSVGRQLHGGPHPVLRLHRKAHSHRCDPRKLSELVKYIALSDPERDGEEEGAEDDQGHRGCDQAKAAEADRPAVLRR